MIAPIVWSLVVVPIVCFAFGLTKQTSAYIAAVAGCWLVTYLGTRHW